MKKYKIGFDMDSIETGLNEAIKGIMSYQNTVSNEHEYILFGDENKITLFLEENNIALSKYSIINTTEKINVSDEPVMSIRRKKNSSIVMGTNMLKEKKIDAFISSGSTGALVAAGIFIVGRIKGVERPALGGAIPKENGIDNIFLLDLGASVDVKVETMQQFAQMGSIYIESFMKKKEPKIGLLNIGEEDTKGNTLYKEAFKVLNNDKSINFNGNVEVRDLFTTDVDVVVMDGFTGNVVLKSIEATVGLYNKSLKEIFKKNLKTIISAILIKKDLKQFAKKYDYKELGGTPILGINGLILKAHGSSDNIAFKNAIRAAIENLDNDLIGKFNNITRESNE